MAHVPVSIEVTAKHALETENLGQLFPAGTRVYLADLGTHGVDDLVKAAARLRDAGFVPVPHMAARRLADHDDLDTRLGRFMSEAGVVEFLMVAGSPASQVGPFPSTLGVLETGLVQQHGIKKIVVAGHPEGSPDFPDSALMPALHTKQEFGAANGIEVVIATQFGFDVARIVAWEKELSQGGITMPVHIGVSGPAKLTTLIRYATLCGVGQSLGFLKKRGGALATMVTGFSPDEVVMPLEQHIAGGDGTLIQQIHVFPFGGLKNSSEWLQNRGNWSLDHSAAA